MTASPKSAPLPRWSRGSNCRSLYAALKIHIKVASLHCTMEEKILLAQMSFVKTFFISRKFSSKGKFSYILVYFFLLSPPIGGSDVCKYCHMSVFVCKWH